MGYSLWGRRPLRIGEGFVPVALGETGDRKILLLRVDRIATVHSIVAWLFNTVILALAVNLAVNPL